MHEVLGFLTKLVAGILLFLAPVKASVLAVFGLVLIDLIFGIIAAKKRGEDIQSRKLAHTPLKFGVYFVTIVAMHLADTYIGLGIPTCKIVTGIIGATEVLSLLEKAQDITGAPVLERVRELLKPRKSERDSGNKEDPSDTAP